MGCSTRRKPPPALLFPKTNNVKEPAKSSRSQPGNLTAEPPHERSYPAEGARFLVKPNPSVNPSCAAPKRQTRGPTKERGFYKKPATWSIAFSGPPQLRAFRSKREARCLTMPLLSVNPVSASRFSVSHSRSAPTRTRIESVNSDQLAASKHLQETLFPAAVSLTKSAVGKDRPALRQSTFSGTPQSAARPQKCEVRCL